MTEHNTAPKFVEGGVEDAYVDVRAEATHKAEQLPPHRQAPEQEPRIIGVMPEIEGDTQETYRVPGQSKAKRGLGRKGIRGIVYGGAAVGIAGATLVANAVFGSGEKAPTQNRENVLEPQPSVSAPLVAGNTEQSLAPSTSASASAETSSSNETETSLTGKENVIDDEPVTRDQLETRVDVPLDQYPDAGPATQRWVTSSIATMMNLNNSYESGQNHKGYRSPTETDPSKATGVIGYNRDTIKELATLNGLDKGLARNKVLPIILTQNEENVMKSQSAERKPNYHTVPELLDMKVSAPGPVHEGRQSFTIRGDLVLNTSYKGSGSLLKTKKYDFQGIATKDTKTGKWSFSATEWKPLA